MKRAIEPAPNIMSARTNVGIDSGGVMRVNTLTFRHPLSSVPTRWWKRAPTGFPSDLLIDDIPLVLWLAAAGRVYLDGPVQLPVLPSKISNPENHYTAPLNPALPLEMRLAFLNSLLGVNWAEFDGLAIGRIPLAMCPFDFDIWCGFSSALLLVNENVVQWENVGEEVDKRTDGLPAESWLVDRARATWVPWLYSPSVAFSFDRAQYEPAIHDEIEFQSDLG